MNTTFIKFLQKEVMGKILKYILFPQIKHLLLQSKLMFTDILTD